MFLGLQIFIKTETVFIFLFHLIMRCNVYITNEVWSDHDQYYCNYSFHWEFRYENNRYVEREKEGDLTQSFDKKAGSKQKIRKQWTTQKRHQNLRLHNDCGPT